MSPALECTGLRAGYGPLTVIRSFDLSVEAGTVVTVLGANGAGKTTLLLTLAGLLPRQGGQVRVKGTMLPSFRPAAAGRAGLVLVPDDRALFCTLTVEENLEAARPRGGAPPDEVVDLFPILRDRWKVKAGALSGGEQQMLAMARGLVRHPRVLLVDEMSMGLAPLVVEKLMPVVRRVADDTGAVVVLVEQHASLALAVSDRALVLTRGEVTLQGPAADIAARPDELQAAYLGSLEAAGPSPA